MSKIGQSARMKQSELAPYVTLGIARVEDGYELRKITLSGTEVKHVKVLNKEKDRAGIMVMMQVALSQYIINFNESQKGD
jgi:hypothetical protein